MGDLFDRGQDVIKTLWFLYRMERQARARGGRLHVLLGNHEIMAFLNDLRYTSAKEKRVARYFNTGYTTMFDIKRSILGGWLASKPGMIKINNILFAHGGVALEFTVYSLRSFNDSLYAYLHENEFPLLLKEGVSTVRGNATLYARRLYFFFGDNSPFWHRGYILSDTLKNDLNKALDKFDARYHVVAHTPVPGIRTFYNRKVFAVDLHKPASEMLLFVRLTYRYRLYRYLLEGKAEPL
jgi:transglutaminase-like putative cysteine protease